MEPKRPLLGIEVASRERDHSRLWLGELDYPDDQILQQNRWDWGLYQALLKDDQIFSCFQQRRLAVVSREWEVRPGGDKRLDLQAADFIRKVLGSIDWDNVTDKMLHGRFYGFAVAEMIWARDGALIYPESIKVKRQSRFRWFVDGSLRLLTWANQYDGESLSSYPHKFWAFRCGGDNDDNPYGYGLAQNLYWPAWFKRNGSKFWARFLETFAAPTPIGKYAPSATLTEKARLLEALEAIRSGAAIAIPENVLIDLLEATRSGDPAYEQFEAYWDRAIAKVILGQTMTSEAVGGQYKADVQMDVRQDLVKADSDLVNGSANQTWVRWLTDWNFPGAAYPTIWRRIENEPDLKPQAERDKFLFDMNFRPTLQYVQAAYGENWVDLQAPVDGAEDKPAPLYQGLGVGGTQSLIQFLSENTLPRNNALAVLTNVFGLSEEQAMTLVPEATTPPTPGEVTGNPPSDSLPPVQQPAAEFAAAPTTPEIFADRLRTLAQPELEKWIDIIRSELNDASDLLEFQQKLDELYPDLDGEDLTRIMATALTASRLAGIYEAQEEES